MKTKRVMVVPYEERWKEEFKKIKAYIKKTLEDCIVGIEHVGITGRVHREGL